MEACCKFFSVIHLHSDELSKAITTRRVEPDAILPGRERKVHKRRNDKVEAMQLDSRTQQYLKQLCLSPTQRTVSSGMVRLSSLTVKEKFLHLS